MQHGAERYPQTCVVVVLQIPEGARVLPADHPRTKSVQFIVDSLAKNVASLEGLPAHMRDVNWTVTVVEHKMVNAMAAPGGQVIVFTGASSTLVLRNVLNNRPLFLYFGWAPVENGSSLGNTACVVEGWDS